MNGTRMSSTFDGRWVKTIVLTRPKRAASGAAASADSPASRLAAASRTPSTRRVDAELLAEPEGDERLGDEAAGEGVEREQRRQPQHDPLRAMQAQPATDAVVDDFGARYLDRGRQKQEEQRQQQAADGVAGNDQPVGIDRGEAGIDRGLRGETGGERAGGRRERSDQLVAGEDGGSSSRRQQLRERRLFDGEERSHLVARRTDHADGGRHQQHDIDGRGDKHQAGGEDEQRADDQHAPAAKTIGVGGQPQRDDDIAEQGQRQQQADLEPAQPQLRQVQDQDDGKKAVAEQAQRARREKERDVGQGGSVIAARGQTLDQERAAGLKTSLSWPK